jgi:hypothetical protein
LRACSNLKGAFEVTVSNRTGFIPGPLFYANGPYATEIEDFEIVRVFPGLISHGREPVAGELRTFMTELDSVLLGTLSRGAGGRQQGAVLISTAFAGHIGQLGIELVEGHLLWRLRVLLEQLAVETIYATRCSCSSVIHLRSPVVNISVGLNRASRR